MPCAHRYIKVSVECDSFAGMTGLGQGCIWRSMHRLGGGLPCKCVMKRHHYDVSLLRNVYKSTNCRIANIVKSAMEIGNA